MRGGRETCGGSTGLSRGPTRRARVGATGAAERRPVGRVAFRVKVAGN